MAIRVEQVTKAYGSQMVVRKVSLAIPTGELFVLLGASGSGKSTLLRLIAGLIAPDSGRIFLNEQDVTALSPQQRETGFVFQNYSLFRHMTVAQNIAFGLDIRRVGRAEREERTAELLDLIGLAGYGDRLPQQLSGGQQQRVALARALAYQPNVLLLDEPFGALDVNIRAQLRQSLRDIQQRLRVTTILVTHDQEEAFEVADRIGIIEAGELLEVGKPQALYARPAHPFTARFLGTANLIPAQHDGDGVQIGGVRLPAPISTGLPGARRVWAMVRPEDVQLTVNGHVDPTLTQPPIARGTVGGWTFQGSRLRVAVLGTELLPEGEPIYAEVRTEFATRHDDGAEAGALRVGAPVSVYLHQFHLIAEDAETKQKGLPEVHS